MPVDLSAIAKWPNVPACYDWLSLDRRGDWRLQGERVTHRGLIELMNRQYGSDESGRWFVQNGPQRVFVKLAYTPWVFRRAGEAFFSHTGQAAGDLKAVYLDDQGSILLDSELGIGLLDDRDLPGFLAECRPNDEASLLALMESGNGDIFWQELPLQAITTVDAEKRFKFESDPRP